MAGRFGGRKPVSVDETRTRYRGVSWSALAFRGGFVCEAMVGAEGSARRKRRAGGGGALRESG